MITCDEIIDADAKTRRRKTKTVPKNKICETNIFYVLLAFLLITIPLLIAVGIYCYLIKYKAKKTKHLLPFYVTNNELKEILC